MAKQYEASYAGYVYEKPETFWKSKEEVENHLTRVDFSQEGQTEVGGIPVISDGKVVYLDGSDAHTAVYAISGMKKSICVFMPTIYALGRAGENMVITDPKGEMYERTAGFLHQQGYDIKCLDFREMNKDGFNILRYITDLYRGSNPDKALMMLNNIVSALGAGQKASAKDPFWPDTGMLWCNGTGALMLEAYPEVDQVNILNWANMNLRDNVNQIDKFVTYTCKVNNVTTNALRQILTSPENTLRSILITASSFFSDFLQNNRLMKMLSYSTFSLEDLCKEKTALYIITDDTTSKADELVGIIVSQIQSFLVDHAYHNGGALDTRMNFVLDEFASYKIPDMDKALATHRSRRIRYFLCVQTLAALRLRYKEPEALLANCGNTLYLGSTEHELLEKISRELGKSNLTENGYEKALASPSELMNLKKAWDYKEGIYINLPEAIRYCTILPSIEAYDLGDDKPPCLIREYPELQTLSFSTLYSEIKVKNIHTYLPRWYANVPKKIDDDE